MDAEAETLFRGWANSTTAIEDPDLRKRSEERFEATKAGYDQIKTAGQTAADLYGVFMKTLEDHITFLGHDLNPTALAGLKPDADKLNEKAAKLSQSIDDTISTANIQMSALRPQ